MASSVFITSLPVSGSHLSLSPILSVLISPEPYGDCPGRPASSLPLLSLLGILHARTYSVPLTHLPPAPQSLTLLSGVIMKTFNK